MGNVTSHRHTPLGLIRSYSHTDKQLVNQTYYKNWRPPSVSHRTPTRVVNPRAPDLLLSGLACGLVDSTTESTTTISTNLVDAVGVEPTQTYLYAGGLQPLELSNAQHIHLIE